MQIVHYLASTRRRSIGGYRTRRRGSGRSKYMPHVGKKEIAKVLARLAAGVNLGMARVGETD